MDELIGTFCAVHSVHDIELGCGASQPPFPSGRATCPKSRWRPPTRDASTLPCQRTVSNQLQHEAVNHTIQSYENIQMCFSMFHVKHSTENSSNSFHTHTNHICNYICSLNVYKDFYIHGCIEGLVIR